MIRRVVLTFLNTTDSYVDSLVNYIFHF